MVKVNTKVISDLKPCTDRYNNWVNHYNDFDGDILEFLELENITARDKVWVSLKILPRFIVEVFAIDCAFRANAAAADAAAYAAAAADAAAYAAAAADAAAAAAYAAYAADAADAAAAYAAYAASIERENQVDSLIMLIKGDKNG